MNANINLRLILILLAVFSFSGCSKFLDVEPPVSKVPDELVFADDAAASSAMIGTYITLGESTNFASGTPWSISTLCGLSSDELLNVPRKDRLFLDFQENNIDPYNENLVKLWGSLYNTIYSVNAILEGVSASKGISTSVKTKLKGEALFIRGFCHFYLTNLFGDVPIVLTTDYNANKKLSRQTSVVVYKQIISDLTMAEDLLSPEYVTGERTRVNKFAASALLSRVYLYTEDWARAEDKATKVINNNNVYNLTLLGNVFLANNEEAIWQLRPTSGDDPRTNEASTFYHGSAISYNSLNHDILSVFENDDQRKAAWVVSYLYENKTLYFPYKFRRYNIGSTLPKEYSVVLRLAEIYLIRAEARLRLDRVPGAISDIDRVRGRAGLPKIQETDPGISKNELFIKIENERRVELLTEWGHRWMDLKRWKLAGAVLSVKKSGWSEDDLLYPIPEIELSRNPFLRPQNPGY